MRYCKTTTEKFISQVLSAIEHKCTEPDDDDDDLMGVVSVDLAGALMGAGLTGATAGALACDSSVEDR